MDDHLKSLKVTDLKAILAKAAVSIPPRKNEMIAKIKADLKAFELYKQLYPQVVDATTLTDDAPLVQPTTTPTPPPEPKSEQPTPAPAPVVDEAEKRRLRAERFGIPLVEPPKPRPAPAVAPQKRSPLDDPNKLASRAARFGNSQKRPAPKESIDPEEEEKRKKRADRFGTGAA